MKIDESIFSKRLVALNACTQVRFTNLWQQDVGVDQPLITVYGRTPAEVARRINTLTHVLDVGTRIIGEKRVHEDRLRVIA